MIKLLIKLFIKNSDNIKDNNIREKYSIRNLFAKITKNKFAGKTEADDSGRWDVVPTKIKMDALLSTDFIVNDPAPDKPTEEKENDHE